MDFGIKDRVAPVLGAVGGLGNAIADRLASDGCDGALAGLNEAALDTVQKSIESAGSHSVSLSWNLRNRSVIAERIDAVENSLGALEILVGNTGGLPPSRAVDPSPETWIDHFEKLVALVFAITGSALPSMHRNFWGRIIAGTYAGVVMPVPNLVVANGLRSTLVGWLKTLATEVARDGVTSNCATPGRIATTRIRSLHEAKAARQGGTVEDVALQSAGDIPVECHGRLEEYADVVAFLASARASVVTDAVIKVDGGLIPSI